MFFFFVSRLLWATPSSPIVVLMVAGDQGWTDTSVQLDDSCREGGIRARLVRGSCLWFKK
jgi:hypothetical protein